MQFNKIQYLVYGMTLEFTQSIKYLFYYSALLFSFKRSYYIYQEIFDSLYKLDI